MSLIIGKNILLSPIYRIYQRRLQEKVKNNAMPIHIAFILDGNRRYAIRKGFDTFVGHQIGAKKVEELIGWCLDLDIKVITLYAFSIENFQRPKEEVKDIMGLLKIQFEKVMTNRNIHRKKVCVKALGKIDSLPDDVKASIKKAEDSTKEYDKYFLNICIAYGSRDEIIEAVRSIAQKVEEGHLLPQDITLETLRQYLFTEGVPDPDLIIRTGGESRLSNFMLFQAAYAELFFIDVYLPAFRKIDFLRIVRDYQKKERRYGK
ncbi:MAG: polyprenyl diphosphate synthase [Candidatus Methanofastidiosia archaeon]